MIKWRSNCHGIKGQVIVGMFYEKELQKKKSKCLQFRVKKVIKRKGNKLHVKWKGYNNFFNSWTDKKRSDLNE